MNAVENAQMTLFCFFWCPLFVIGFVCFLLGIRMDQKQRERIENLPVNKRNRLEREELSLKQKLGQVKDELEAVRAMEVPPISEADEVDEFQESTIPEV